MKVLFYSIFFFLSTLLTLFLFWLLPYQIGFWTRSAGIGRQKWVSAWISAFFILLYGGTGKLWVGICFSSFTPLIWVVLGARRHKREEKELVDDFFSFLLALQGLSESGNSFPVSLYQLTEKSSGRFTCLMKSILESFENGESLEILIQKIKRDPLATRVANSLQLMEMASRKGLTLGPLLESLISVLELEIQAAERIKSLHRSLGAQAFIAALIPWCLGAAAALFQPELVGTFFQTSLGPSTLIGTLIFEGIGLWVVREVTRFY